MLAFKENASRLLSTSLRMQLQTALPTMAPTLFNMRSLVIFLATLIGTILAQRGVSKSSPSASLLIIKQDSQVNPDGSYSYSFETENGISVAESGYLKNAGSQDEAQTVQGTFSYTAPDGTPITVTHTADENGFNAQGAHLPVGPELPPLIAKALACNAAKASERGDNHNKDFQKPFGSRRSDHVGIPAGPAPTPSILCPPIERPNYPSSSGVPVAPSIPVVQGQVSPVMPFHSGEELFSRH